jgi:hypothetical protein
MLMLTLAIADATTPWSAAVNYWMDAPKLDRPLYILVNDEQVQAADPHDMLYWSLSRSGFLTSVDAKKLHAESAFGTTRLFRDVPGAALDRFLQLVQDTEVTGTLLRDVLHLAVATHYRSVLLVALRNAVLLIPISCHVYNATLQLVGISDAVAALTPCMLLVLRFVPLGVEADIYNHSVRDAAYTNLGYFTIHFTQQQTFHSRSFSSAVTDIKLVGCGCYNMATASKLIANSPCLRNVPPDTKVYFIELIEAYNTPCKCLHNIRTYAA